MDELELDAGTNKLLRENNVSLVEDALKAHVAADLLAVDGDGPPQVVDIDARTIGREGTEDSVRSMFASNTLQRCMG